MSHDDALSLWNTLHLDNKHDAILWPIVVLLQVHYYKWRAFGSEQNNIIRVNSFHSCAQRTIDSVHVYLLIGVYAWALKADRSA